jgi:hypothetical protein
MLMERLFASCVMQMGPSRVDPGRRVGVFNPAFVAELPALRTAKMEEFRWVVGEWNYENIVPATSANPAYTDVGTGKYALCEKSTWVCLVIPDGRELPIITFDPFSRQWIYLLMQGAYGMLRSQEGWRNGRIAFTGLMTMLGINCEWRLTWSKESDERFSFVNEERGSDGSWVYIDEWRFVRKA